jgi:hypothetical protein
MRMLVIVFFSGCFSAFGQLTTLDVSGGGTGASGFLKFNNPSTIGQKTTDKLNYSETRGTAFWASDWHQGVLVLKGGHVYKIHEIKLNLYTDEVYYIDNKGMELVAQPGTVMKLTLYEAKDTSKIAAVFLNTPVLTNKHEDSFLEQLNEGKRQLLKQVVVSLVKGEYDPGLGKAEYRFVPSIYYYINDGEKVSPLKNFGKESVASLVTITPEQEEWLKSTKNKLKRESDVVAFFRYLNSAD